MFLTKLKNDITRIIKAFGYSLAGLKATFQSEPAFRQELLFMVFALPFALLISVSATSKALMIGSLFLILIAELINTAIEAVVDRISEEKHILSKKAKDVGSAIVFIALLNAACIWAIILI